MPALSLDHWNVYCKDCGFGFGAAVAPGTPLEFAAEGKDGFVKVFSRP